MILLEELTFSVLQSHESDFEFLQENFCAQNSVKLKRSVGTAGALARKLR